MNLVALWLLARVVWRTKLEGDGFHIKADDLAGAVAGAVVLIIEVVGLWYLLAFARAWAQW